MTSRNWTSLPTDRSRPRCPLPDEGEAHWPFSMYPTEGNLSGFFGAHDTERHLYDVFSGRILAGFPDTQVKVHRTQISFYHRHLLSMMSCWTG